MFNRSPANEEVKENERNIIYAKKGDENFYIVQIAGLIARRIVCNLKIDQEVKKGHRIGIIKFGSRVDLYLPKNYNVLIPDMPGFGESEDLTLPHTPEKISAKSFSICILFPLP